MDLPIRQPDQGRSGQLSARASILFSGSRGEQTVAGKAACGAAGAQNQHILGHQGFDQLHEGLILGDLDIIAAGEQAHTQDIAVDDVVEQRLERVLWVDQGQYF